MARNSRVLRALFHIIFVWLFLNALEISNGTETDIYCLKSIKDSLEDPYNRLKDSWNFSNKTEGSICRFTGVECWFPDESKVLNIRLSGMMLRGQFPLGIKNCSSLTGLDLSDNELSGPLPFDIADLLSYITSLDLSVNKFSGEIPKSISNCSYLSVLKLDNNQLTGEIPPEMSKLKRLKLLNVSNNQLSGSVPVFDNGLIIAESYANNKKLCGGPLEPCSKRGLRFDFSFKSGFLVGYPGPVVTAMAIFMYRYVGCMNGKQSNKKMTRPNKNKKADQVNRLQINRRVQEGIGKNSQLEGNVTRMNFTELSEASNNFSTDNAIGPGKIGVTYKATLPNGSLLAVKRLHGCESFEKQFICELLALDRLRHNNIVPLLGFCRERKEKLLVYQYIPNGNLYDWLHARESNDKILEWPLRIKIAIGIAKGLVWLHHKCNFRVVHLNLSSSCILLDNKFEPKISNFGGSKISTFEGAMFMDSNDDSSNSSFVDNGVWELGFVKKDVYDFGLLLLELIIGKELNQIDNYPNSLSESLVDWYTHLLTSSSDVYSIIDKPLLGRGFDGEIFQFLRIACTCLKPFPAQRPTMLELYNTISILGERYGVTNDAEILRQSEIATASVSNEIVEVEIT